MKTNLAFFFFAAIASAQSVGISTWSVQVNTPAWNKALGVTTSRQGCPDPPASCMSFTGRVAKANNVRITLAITLNSSTTADYATQYSQMSLTGTFLNEISIDDFRDQYRALFSNTSIQPAALVNTVITNVKSANPNLKFGATVYEDELTNPDLQDARLPAATRARFDTVHLFIHYRMHGPDYATYVQQAKQLFPNAKIIAGAYAYDRRNYLPCLPAPAPNCTAQQDVDLFNTTITLQFQMLNSGIIDGIEFFPGYFGAEETWPGLNEPRECATGGQTACITNTKAMRLAAYNAIVKRSISQSNILNSGSLKPGPVSPGEIVALLGTGLGSPDGATLQLASPNFVGTSLAGAQVFFDGVAAPLVYAQANQMNAIVPYEVANHASTQVQVMYAGVPSNTVTLPVTTSAPSLFTSNASGAGQGAVLNEDLSLNSAANPARRGGLIILYGTGEGQTNPPGIDGRIATDPLESLPRPVLPVMVMIGGMPADFTYAGAVPTVVAGLFQINARVPMGIAPGNSVPVVVLVGTAASQPAVTVALR